MSVEIFVIFLILIGTVVLFFTERVSFDITALIVLSSLLLTGILTPAEALSGFSSEATITIGAMFVLSEGMRQTGVLDIIGHYFSRLGKQHASLAVISMMLVVGVISAFINNTAAVAIFIPVVLAMATSLNISPSKLLIPLSFASMFGGVSTLIGTSTNILVSSIAQQHGQVPFTMFEFAPLGIILSIAGLMYLYFIGIPLLPERRAAQEATTRFNMNEYLADVRLSPGFPYFGHSVESSALTKKLDLDIVQLFRQDGTANEQGTAALFQPGDTLRIRGNAGEIQKLLAQKGISLKPAKVWHDGDLEKGNNTLVEAVIAPDADVVGQTLHDVDFPARYGAVVLAIRHHGKLHQDEMEQIRLSGGDSILLDIRQDHIVEVERNQSFVIVSEVSVPDHRTEKKWIAVTILVGVVAAAALNIIPIVVSAIIGSILLVVTGCLTLEEAHSAIHWKIILLLAGLIPLGVAMEKTGAAEVLAIQVLSIGEQWGPLIILSAFFFLAMVLTNFISNQATAVVLAPIALEVAATLGVSPRPFLMAVTYAASLSFMTPVGYQTNTLIYAPGQYKFTDFTKVGTPLNIIFWVLATIFIPLFWPL
jgi:di/tricarboxylate transporter